MISSSRVIAGGCLAMAVAIHAAAGFVVTPEEAPMIEGGVAGDVAALGSSLADFARGSVGAEPVETVAERVSPAPHETAAPTTTAVTETAPAAPASPPTVARTPEVESATAVPSPQAAPKAANAARPSAVSPAAAPALAATAQPLAPSRRRPLPQGSRHRASRRHRPRRHRTKRGPPPPYRRMRQCLPCPTPKRVSKSRPGRPSRPARFAEIRPPKPEPVVRQQPAANTNRPVRQPAPPAPGNSSVNARKGTSDGQTTGTSARSSQGNSSSSAAGNAKAANYSGQVLRAISRAKRGSLGTKRRVLVSFTIGGSGGLSAVSVSRSSGNTRADNAAISQVRRAAPFPAPPPGARRSFSVEIGDR